MRGKLTRVNQFNDPALTIAVNRGLTEVVSLLLENKADVNIVNTALNSSLTLAAGRGSVEITKLLLDHKANVNSVNKVRRPIAAAAAAALQGEEVRTHRVCGYSINNVGWTNAHLRCLPSRISRDCTDAPR